MGVLRHHETRSTVGYSLWAKSSNCWNNFCMHVDTTFCTLGSLCTVHRKLDSNQQRSWWKEHNTRSAFHSFSTLTRYPLHLCFLASDCVQSEASSTPHLLYRCWADRLRREWICHPGPPSHRRPERTHTVQLEVCCSISHPTVAGVCVLCSAFQFFDNQDNICSSRSMHPLKHTPEESLLWKKHLRLGMTMAMYSRSTSLKKRLGTTCQTCFVDYTWKFQNSEIVLTDLHQSLPCNHPEIQFTVAMSSAYNLSQLPLTEAYLGQIQLNNFLVSVDIM